MGRNLFRIQNKRGERERRGRVPRKGKKRGGAESGGSKLKRQLTLQAQVLEGLLK